jgi:hypothetical protein
MDYKKKNLIVTSETKLTILMERNGGWAGSLK